MTKRQVVHLMDDLDGSVAGEHVTFGLRGIEYEIDLSAENLTALEVDLARYIVAARVRGHGSSGEVQAAGSTGARRRSEPRSMIRG
jgi:hypothetical protein